MRRRNSKRINPTPMAVVAGHNRADDLSPDQRNAEKLLAMRKFFIDGNARPIMRRLVTKNRFPECNHLVAMGRVVECCNKNGGTHVTFPILRRNTSATNSRDFVFPCPLTFD